DNDEGIRDNVEDKQDEDSDAYEEELGSAVKMDRNEIHCSYAWNIRGLGKVKKQNAVKNLIMNEGLSMCAVLETRLKGDKVKRIRDKVFGRWDWIENGKFCKRGCRILIGWNNATINCGVVHATDHVVLCMLEVLSTKEKLYCCFVHVENDGRLRRRLWTDLSMFKAISNNTPMVIMVDLNVTLHLDEHSEGISSLTQDMEEFKDCINALKFEDVCSTGMHFTWIKSLLNPNSSILKKIDRVMGSKEFMD
ncbi:RNA-directed DNA polymerase, eukaryota, reverse transcriptase zinc-binding domain protein, partial [Tanacetum coccineum]